MSSVSANPVHSLWLLISALMVAVVPAGLRLIQTRMLRRKEDRDGAAKALVSFLVAAATFWAVGFGILFGTSYDGLCGTSYFAPSGESGGSLLAVVCFQMMLCTTAASIVSGLAVDRLRFGAAALTAFVVAGCAYPLFGHWAWGGVLEGRPSGWLAELGFRDCAGATVVHGLAAWLAPIVVGIAGPRFDRGRRVNPASTVHRLPTTAVLGTLLVCLGALGANGGSSLALTDRVPVVLLNTILAGIAGGLAAIAVARTPEGKPDVAAILRGLVGGLIAIAAPCNLVSSGAALAVGGAAGVIAVRCAPLLQRRYGSDVAGILAVDGLCGVWGTLAVALFGDLSYFPHGHSRIDQLFVQVVGVGTCFLWAKIVGHVVLGGLHELRNFRDIEATDAAARLAQEQPWAAPRPRVRLESQTAENFAAAEPLAPASPVAAASRSTAASRSEFVPQCEDEIQCEAQLREFVALCEVAAASLTEMPESTISEEETNASFETAQLETAAGDVAFVADDEKPDDIQFESLLARCHGDHEFAGQVLEKFRKRLPEELSVLRQAVENQDIVQVRTVARQLKARAGQVGATSVSREAAALETAVLEPNTNCDLSALERNADACLDTLDRMLRAFAGA